MNLDKVYLVKINYLFKFPLGSTHTYRDIYSQQSTSQNSCYIFYMIPFQDKVVQAYYILINRDSKMSACPRKTEMWVTIGNKLVLLCSATPSRGCREEGVGVGGQQEKELGIMKSSLDYHGIWPSRRYRPEGNKCRRHYSIKLTRPKWPVWHFIQVKGVSKGSSLGNQENGDGSRKRTQKINKMEDNPVQYLIQFGCLVCEPVQKVVVS